MRIYLQVYELPDKRMLNIINNVVSAFKIVNQIKKLVSKQYFLSLENSTEKRAAFWVEVGDPKRVAEKQGHPDNSEGQGNKRV